jgi:hypothetical protein
MPYLTAVLKRGYHSSAISPLLWLNALVTIPCLIAATVIQDQFRWAPFALGCSLLLYTLWTYGKLVKMNPRLVQSERYQVEMQKLDIVAAKGGKVQIEPVALELSPDPRTDPGARSLITEGEEPQE